MRLRVLPPHVQLSPSVSAMHLLSADVPALNANQSLHAPQRRPVNIPPHHQPPPSDTVATPTQARPGHLRQRHALRHCRQLQPQPDPPPYLQLDTGMKITGGVADERVFGDYGPADPAQVLSDSARRHRQQHGPRHSTTTPPSELILTPRTGGPTSTQSKRPGFDDTIRPEPPAPPLPTARSNQPPPRTAPDTARKPIPPPPPVNPASNPRPPPQPNSPLSPTPPTESRRPSRSTSNSSACASSSSSRRPSPNTPQALTLRRRDHSRPPRKVARKI